MIISGVTVICFCVGEVHMQLTLNLPENFNIYDHMAELKAQGFMLLSFIKQEFGEIKKIKIKTKLIAQKLGVHVSTLRRWIKRLMSLGFAVTPCSDKAKPERLVRGPVDSALSADHAAHDLNAIRNDKEAEEEIPDQVRGDDKSSTFRGDKPQVRDDIDGMPYTPLARALLERFKPLAGRAEEICAATINRFTSLKDDYEQFKLGGAVADLKHLQSFR